MVRVHAPEPLPLEPKPSSVLFSHARDAQIQDYPKIDCRVHQEQQ